MNVAKITASFMSDVSGCSPEVSFGAGTMLCPQVVLSTMNSMIFSSAIKYPQRQTEER